MKTRLFNDDNVSKLEMIGVNNKNKINKRIENKTNHR